MKKSIKYLGLLSIFSAITVFAEDAVTPPTAAPAPAAPAQAPLSVAEMTTRSSAMIKADDNAYRELLHLKEVATKQKDVIKLSCVNDKLVQLKAQMQIADSTNVELQGALTSNSDSRFPLFQQLSSNTSDVSQTLDAGRACVGESELYKQEAGLDVQRPDIPDDPGTIDPYNPDGTATPTVLDPPGYASPFN